MGLRILHTVPTARWRITACRGLSYEPRSEGDDQWPELSKLGQTGKIEAERGDGNWFGAEAAAAELKAIQARERAAQAETKDGMSERQLQAIMNHANSEVSNVVSKEELMEHVESSMARELTVEDREMEDFLRKGNKILKEDEEYNFKKAKGRLFKKDEPEYDVPKDKAVKIQVHKQEQAQAQEESQAAKDIVLARKGWAKIEAKEKAYEHERGLMEHEIGVRLSKQADAMRREAANGTITVDEIVTLLDVTAQDYDNMTRTIAGFGRTNMTGVWIEEKLRESGLKTAGASAKMLGAVNHSVEEFKNSHRDYDDHQFLATLAHLLNETKSEIISFQQTKDKLANRLQHWDGANGEKLTYNLAVALQGVTDSVEFRNHLLHIDAAGLAHASVSEACDLLSNVVHDSMQPAYKSVLLQRQRLDEMSKIAPSVIMTLPSNTQGTMAKRTAAVVNMAYVEHLALMESATMILKEAAPIVMQRLHCNMKSASPRAGFVTALFAAVAAWLAQ
ncbi:unnamed protein product [Prorocentrum cordatum]|uniref:Uncharacterized protein n=1 Tax=Prorocentrum cordatum TaxID=2364126 RepID=A0ABN9T1P7_9DINO|nr:unnamed protein product [Polarella glacialis]